MQIIQLYISDTLKRNIIPISEAKRFIVDCFTALKVPDNHAQLMASLLVAADYRGHLRFYEIEYFHQIFLKFDQTIKFIY